MRVLVTGGSGYIGSHACALLLERGHEVTSVDAMLPGRASPHAAATLGALAGDSGRFRAFVADVNDRAALDHAFSRARPDAVMHFAGVAYVGESVRDPLLYHRTNTGGTESVLRACAGHGVTRLVFSSSCVTYGDPGAAALPVTESCPQRPVNPYGWSKLHAERVVTDYAESPGARSSGFGAAVLRYFNVAGCGRRGRLGHTHDPETRVIPLAIRAALGIDASFTVFGTDYPGPGSPDGTAVRDYVHVEDLVEAHALVLEALRPGDRRVYNLGTGRGTSVRRIIESVERVTGRRVPVVEGARREGDPASLFCSPGAIERDLGWRARVTDLDEIVASSAAWMKKTLGV